jgi:hypothetical protein
MAELNYGLSELALEIRSMVREFAVSRVKPVRAELGRRPLHPQRHQAVDHQRRRGRDLHRLRHDRQDQGRARRQRFIVEKGTPGFTFGKKEDKMGIRASPPAS